MRRPDPASVEEDNRFPWWDELVHLPRVRRGREEGVMAVDIREKLVGLANDVLLHLPWGEIQKDTAERIADRMMDHGVTIQEWIPVTERLPEDDPTVKKHIEGEKFGFLTVLVYNGVVKETNRFFSNEPRYGLPKTNGWEWASSNVTHWMPLPQPPEGG